MNGTATGQSPARAAVVAARAPRVLWVSLAQEWSGAEESLLGILRQTPGVVGVAVPDGPFAERLRQEGVAPLPLPVWAPRLGPAGWAAAATGLARLTRACQAHARATAAELIAANGLRAAMGVGLAVGLPAIWAIRDNVPGGAVGALARMAAQRRDVTVVANSRFVAAQCRRVLGPGVSVQVIHPGVHWPQAVPCLRAELGVDRRVPVVGVVGQITPWKRQHDALAAVHIARGVHPQLRLVVIGSPKFRPENQRYLERLRSEAAADGARTLFLGERSDLPALYPDMDALVVPSSAEPFGRVAAEALGYGVPVVGTVPGGLAEIVVGRERGRLVPSGDVAALARALLQILEQGRLAPGTAGRVREEFAAETAGRHWAGMYRTAFWGALRACAA